MFAISFESCCGGRRRTLADRPKIHDIIEFRGPNNPKKDTNNDMSVISFKFLCKYGQWGNLNRRAGWGT